MRPRKPGPKHTLLWILALFAGGFMLAGSVAVLADELLHPAAQVFELAGVYIAAGFAALMILARLVR